MPANNAIRVKSVKTTDKKGAARFKEAAAQIQRGLIQSAYLLFGEESYLQDLFVQLLRESWLGHGADETCTAREDGKAMSQAQAVDLACQTQLFSGRKLLLIDEPAFIPCGKEQGENKTGSDNPGDFSDAEGASDAEGPIGAEAEKDGVAGAREEEAEAGGVGFRAAAKPDRSRAPSGGQPLLAYLEQPAPFTCMVFRFRKGRPDRRSKLTGEIAKKGGLVEAAALTPEERVPYLREAAQKLGKHCPQVLLAQIARQPGGLAFCVRELEKLAVYAGDAPEITREMLDKVLSPNLESDIFRLVDALGRQRQAEALWELRALLDNGEPPFAIFAMMLRQFRLIFRAKACAQEGMGSRQIAQALSLHPYVAEKAASQSRLYTFSGLEQVMALFCEKDLAMKSSRQSEYSRILTDLVISLMLHSVNP